MLWWAQVICGADGMEWHRWPDVRVADGVQVVVWTTHGERALVAILSDGVWRETTVLAVVNDVSHWGPITPPQTDTHPSE
jgi:hypothetical protein